MAFYDNDSPGISLAGTLTSFGSPADGKIVKRGNFTLEGNTGSGWATITADKYFVRKSLGRVELKDIDDSDNLLDWSSYMDYQDLGNDAFRGTYTVKVQAGTSTTYTEEVVEIAEIDAYLPFTESGEIDGELPQNLWVQEIHAEYGDIGGWNIDDDQIWADNNKAIINSATPFISLGNLVTGWMVSGSKGFWVGKDSGDWKMHLGDPDDEYMAWDGSNLIHTGHNEEPGTVGGRVNGWKIKAGYMLSKNEKVRIDANDQYFAAGNTVPTAYGNNPGIWVGYDTSVAKMSLYTDANNYLQYNGSVLTWKAANTSLDASGNLTATSATLSGAITATSGAIGGFDIGADYVRDTANTFGLASTVTGGDDVRFWAGAAFASRASAPLQIYESGLIFAKDIILAKGELSGASGVTGYGYAVGDPLLLLHFDGAKPFELDTRGSLIGHKGQAGTWTWGGTQGRGMFRPGKFNKGVEIAEATTNLITNPSWETNQTGWSVLSGTFATNARTTNQNYTGSYSNALVNSSGSNAILSHDFTANATTSTVSIYVYRLSGSGAITLYLQEDFAPFTVIGSVNASATTGEWQRLVVSGATTATSSYRLRVDVADGVTCYLDSAQAEGKAYVTPYCDGYMSADGHSWSGTAHASTSSRTISLLTYDASGNINLAQGTLSYWFYMPSSNTTPCYDFGVRIDANNYLNVRHIFAGARTPAAASANGGSAVDTSSGATTAAVDTWHHVVVTWTTGALKLYLNGVQSGATATYAVPTGTASTIEIGSFNSTQVSNTVIDELCVLGHVLTLNEIKSIYYSDAPLMVGISSQEFRLAGVATGDVFGNANGLFARGADGTPSFGLLNATVNATTWGGASESFDAGDFMFGSNKASKSNLFWDASTGRLNFRGATTTHLYVDTAGALNFAGGTQKLDANGYQITVDDTYDTTRAITWKEGSDVIAQLWMEGGASASADNVFLDIDPPVDRHAVFSLRLTPTGGGVASVNFNLADSSYTFSEDGSTFNQSTSDLHILTFASPSDVDHGMTTETETNVYGAFRKSDGDAGGLDIRGFRDASAGAGNALRLRGHLGEAADTTHSSAGLGVVDIDASIKSGTTITAVGTNGNLLTIRNNASARFIFDAEGDGFYDGAAWAGYDAHDDIALLNMLNHFLLSRKGLATMDNSALTDAGEHLQSLKLVSANPDSSPFVNMTKLQALNVGAIRQIGSQINNLAERLARIEKKLVA